MERTWILESGKSEIQFTPLPIYLWLTDLEQITTLSLTLLSSPGKWDLNLPLLRVAGQIPWSNTHQTQPEAGQAMNVIVS